LFCILETREPVSNRSLLEYELKPPAPSDWVPLIGHIFKLDKYNSSQVAKDIFIFTDGDILQTMAVLRNTIENERSTIALNDIIDRPVVNIDVLDQEHRCMIAYVIVETGCSVNMLSQLMRKNCRLLLESLKYSGILYVDGTVVKHSLTESRIGIVFGSLLNPENIHLNLYAYHIENANLLRSIECIVEAYVLDAVSVKIDYSKVLYTLKHHQSDDPSRVLKVSIRLLFDCELINRMEDVNARQYVLDICHITCQLLVNSKQFMLIENIYLKVVEYLTLEQESDYIVFFIDAFKQRQEYEAALNVGLEYVGRAGIKIQRKNSKTLILAKYLYLQCRLEKTDLATLINLPTCTNINIKKADRVLFHMGGAAYMLSTDIFAPTITIEAINGALDHGLVPEHAFAFACYSYLILHHVPTFSQAMKVARAKKYLAVAKQIENRFNDQSYHCRLALTSYGFILPWLDDIEKCVIEVRNAYLVGRQSGDHEYALYACAIGNLMAFMRGLSLTEIIEQAWKGFDHAVEFQQATTQANLALLIQTCEFGLGLIHNPKHITNVPYVMAKAGETIPDDDNTAKFVYHYLRAVIAIWRFDFESAKYESSCAIECQEGVSGQLISAHNIFLYSFSTLRLGNMSTQETKKVLKYIDKFRYLNGMSAASFSHYYYCLKAMYVTRIEGEDVGAGKSYLSRSIENALDNRFTLDLPLFYLEQASRLTSAGAFFEAKVIYTKSIDVYAECGLSQVAALWRSALNSYIEPRYEDHQVFNSFVELAAYFKKSIQVVFVVFISPVSRKKLDSGRSSTNSKQDSAEYWLAFDYVTNSIEKQVPTINDDFCCVPVLFNSSVIGVSILKFLNHVPGRASLERIAKNSKDLFVSNYVEHDRRCQRQSLQDAYSYIAEREDQWANDMLAIKEIIDNRQEQLKQETELIEESGLSVCTSKSLMNSMILDNRKLMINSLKYHYQDLTNVMKKRLNKQSIVSKQHFDIQVIAESLKDRYRRLADAKGIEFEIEAESRVIFNDAYLLTHICSTIINELFVKEKYKISVRLSYQLDQTFISISDSVKRSITEIEGHNKRIDEMGKDPFGLWKIKSLIQATGSYPRFCVSISSTTLVINIGGGSDSKNSISPLLIAGEVINSEIPRLLSLFKYRVEPIEDLGDLSVYTEPVRVICTEKDYKSYCSKNSQFVTVNWIILSDEFETKKSDNCYFVRHDSFASVISVLESLSTDHDQEQLLELDATK